MKKIITMSIVAFSLLFQTISYAQFSEEPKLTRDFAKVISPWNTYSIEVVKTMPKDTYITVEGYLKKRVAGDKGKYLFKDESDSIVIEIDDDLWKGQVVSPETKIKVLGELDRSVKKEKIEIDAKYLEIIR